MVLAYDIVAILQTEPVLKNSCHLRVEYALSRHELESRIVHANTGYLVRQFMGLGYERLSKKWRADLVTSNISNGPSSLLGGRVFGALGYDLGNHKMDQEASSKSRRLLWTP